jgi:hypothetical protein
MPLSEYVRCRRMTVAAAEVVLDGRPAEPFGGEVRGSGFTVLLGSLRTTLSRPACTE